MLTKEHLIWLLLVVPVPDDKMLHEAQRDKKTQTVTITVAAASPGRSSAGREVVLEAMRGHGPAEQGPWWPATETAVVVTARSVSGGKKAGHPHP
jgi:hypothetical protein